MKNHGMMLDPTLIFSSGTPLLITTKITVKSI